jgi:hypothetical protein
VVGVGRVSLVVVLALDVVNKLDVVEVCSGWGVVDELDESDG